MEHEKSKKNVTPLTLKFKIVIMTSLIMIISIFLISYIFYNKMYSHTVRLLKGEGLNIAKATSMLIDGDKFETVANNLDKNSVFYQEAKKKLQELNRELGEGMLYIIADQDPDYYTYIIDGTDVNIHVGFKQTKDDFSKEAQMTFDTGKVHTSDPYYVESFNKYYISAFVPILNSSNKVVGVVEYDYQESEFSKKLNAVRNLIIVVAVGLVLLTIIINYIILKKMFKPIEKLIQNIDLIAKGDLTLSIDTSREDEIGNVNLALNKTIDSLRNMVVDVKKSSIRAKEVSAQILKSAEESRDACEALATSTSEISLISYEQISKTKKIKEVLSKLNEDIHYTFNRLNVNPDGSNQMKRLESIDPNFKSKMSALKEMIELMVSNMDYVTTSVDEIDKVSKIIDNHTMCAVAVAQEQMATSQEFMAMIEGLNQEAQILNEYISRFKIEN